MKQFKFKAKVSKPAENGTWHFANVPIKAEQEFGKKGPVKVKATLNGKMFYNWLIPHGNGMHYIILNDVIRRQAGVKVGDTINMTIEEDLRANTVELPEDFETALIKNTPALEYFITLTSISKKGVIEWLSPSEKGETRTEKIAKAVETLEKKERLD